MYGLSRGTFHLLEALLVTFLWSSSYVLIKNTLHEIPPLAFASLRYIIGFAILLIAYSVISRRNHSGERIRPTEILVLGVTGYSIAQGLQFVALARLPATTVTFILNFTPLMVLALGTIFMKEKPVAIQLAGLLLALSGAYIYFGTAAVCFDLFGVAATLLSGLGWAIYLILMRQHVGKGRANLTQVTALTMGTGAAVLFPFWLAGEGVPAITLSGWGTILWLSVFNTALAFALWNHALKHVPALNISILQNTMLVQVGLLAFVFLNETLTSRQIIGMIMVLVGVLLVQLRLATVPSGVGKPAHTR